MAVFVVLSLCVKSIKSRNKSTFYFGLTNEHLNNTLLSVHTNSTTVRYSFTNLQLLNGLTIFANDETNFTTRYHELYLTSCSTSIFIVQWTTLNLGY